jgi:hypothetical protein
MKPLVFLMQKSRVAGVCEHCKSELPHGILIARQGTLCFHPKCFEKHLTEQAARYKQAIIRLRKENHERAS